MYSLSYMAFGEHRIFFHYHWNFLGAFGHILQSWLSAVIVSSWTPRFFQLPITIFFVHRISLPYKPFSTVSDQKRQRRGCRPFHCLEIALLICHLFLYKRSDSGQLSEREPVLMPRRWTLRGGSLVNTDILNFCRCKRAVHTLHIDRISFAKRFHTGIQCKAPADLHPSPTRTYASTELKRVSKLIILQPLLS